MAIGLGARLEQEAEAEHGPGVELASRFARGSEALGHHLDAKIAMATEVPEGREVGRHAEGVARLTVREKPSQGGIQIAAFTVEPIQPGERKRLEKQCVERGASQLREPSRVSLGGGIAFPGRDELLETELAHDTEHVVAQLVGGARIHGQEVLIDERTDDGERFLFRRTSVERDRPGGVQREAAFEDAQPAQEHALLVREEVVTPSDRVAHGALTVGKVASAAG